MHVVLAVTVQAVCTTRPLAQLLHGVHAVAPWLVAYEPPLTHGVEYPPTHMLPAGHIVCPVRVVLVPPVL